MKAPRPPKERSKQPKRGYTEACRLGTKTHGTAAPTIDVNEMHKACDYAYKLALPFLLKDALGPTVLWSRLNIRRPLKPRRCKPRHP